MKKFLILNIFVFMLVSLVLPSRTLATGGAWVPVGSAVSTGGAGQTSLVFDSNIPYVAYRDYNNGNKATVMKFVDGAWAPVGSAVSAGQVSFISSLTFNSNIPYVAYGDGNNGYRATVKRFVDGAWAPVGSAVSAGQAYSISLAFDSNIPYLAYRDNNNGDKATVMKFDGTNWLPVGSAVSAGSAGYTSFAFDSNIPYVAYGDVNNGYKATVKKFDGTNWLPVGSAVSAGNAGYTSLAFDSNIPYVAYSDNNNGSKATVMKFDGTNWVQVGSTVSVGGADYTSLVFDSNIPYVAYKDYNNSNKATVKKFDGTNWLPVGSAVSAGQATFISLTFNSNIPYVAYSDDNNGDKATVMKLFTDPIITSYSGNFSESYSDDGSVTGSKVITLGNDTFVNTSGTLTQNTHYTLSPIPAGLTPVMTVSGDGATATLTFTGNAVSSIPVDSVANLTITFLNGAFTNTPLASGVVNYSNDEGSINFISHSFQGTQILYGADGAGKNLGTVNLYTLDPSTGNILTTIGPTGHNINGMSFNPISGTLYGVTSNGDDDGSSSLDGTKQKSLFTIDIITGVATWVGEIQDSELVIRGISDMAFNPDGKLYIVANDYYDVTDIYTVDDLTCPGHICSVTKLTNVDFGKAGAGLAFDSNDNLYLLMAEYDYIHKINPDNGEILSTTSYSNPSGDDRVMTAAKFDGNDNLFASRSNKGGTPSDLVKIDLITGEITSTQENNPIMPYMTALAFYLEPSEPAEETCSDGIKNQDETGIDEGGVCTPEPEPDPEPIPVVHHTSSGSSVSVRYNNLLTMGNTSAAQALAQQFPNQITTPPTTIAGCDNRTTGFSITTGQSCLGNTGTPITIIAGCDNRTTGFSTTTGQSCLLNTGTTTTNSPSLNEEPIIYNFGPITLKNGSVGEAVKELQRFLNAKLNLGLVVDGNFGPKTKQAVIKFQLANQLVGDGIVGPLTQAKLK